jgi:hypothetical protein
MLCWSLMNKIFCSTHQQQIFGNLSSKQDEASPRGSVCPANYIALQVVIIVTTGSIATSWSTILLGLPFVVYHHNGYILLI